MEREGGREWERGGRREKVGGKGRERMKDENARGSWGEREGGEGKGKRE